MNLSKLLKELEKIENQLPYQTFVNDGVKDRIDASFYFDKTNGKGYLEVIFGPLCVGPPGFAHGGAIASVLDESMGATAWLNGNKVMTMKLEVGYLRPVVLNTKILGEFYIEKVYGKNVELIGKLISENEKITYAESKGIFRIVDNKKFENIDGLDSAFRKILNN